MPTEATNLKGTKSMTRVLLVGVTPLDLSIMPTLRVTARIEPSMIAFDEVILWTP